MGFSNTGQTQGDLFLFNKGIVINGGGITFRLETGRLVVDSISGLSSGVNFLDGLTASAPISGSLDGNIIATTQAISDDSTRVATTAFVYDAIPNSGLFSTVWTNSAFWGSTNSKWTDSGTTTYLTTTTDNIAIGTTIAEEALTVAGHISASGSVTVSGGDSDQWISNFTTVNTRSAAWDSTNTSVYNNSAQWGLNTADLANVIAASGAWNSTNTSVFDNSANWNQAYDSTTLLALNSGAWNSTNTSVYDNSAAWVSTNTSVYNNSAQWGLNTADLANVITASGAWNSTNTSVYSNSANWNIAYNSTTLLALNSANWNQAYGSTTLLALNSGAWNSTNTTVYDNSAKWVSTYSTLYTNSGDWESVWTTVNTDSADWNNTETTLRANSGDWYNTHNAVYPNSANWSAGYDRKLNGAAFDSSNGVLTLTLQTAAVTVDLDDRWVSGTGTAGYLPTWGATAYTLGESNIYSTGSRAAINATVPTFALLVSGAGTGEASISARDIIYGGPSNCTQWFSVFNTTNATSARWEDVHSTVNSNSAAWSLGGGGIFNSSLIAAASGAWNSTNTTVYGNSAAWVSTNATVFGNSATWSNTDKLDSTNTTVWTNSANWVDAYTWVYGNSASWSVLPTNSARWSTAHTSLTSSSANWVDAYTWVYGNSASWSVLPTNSARWSTAHTTLTSKSANWENTYSTLYTNSGDWVGTNATVFATSADWVSVTSTVQSTSSHWNSGGGAGTTLQITSGDWESTNTTVFNNSASWSGSLCARRIAFAVTAANTFTVGEVIRNSADGWNRGSAYLPASADIVGVVQAATSTKFTYIHSGELTLPSHGFTVGSNLFLDTAAAGAGNMTETDAILVGTVSKPLGVVIDTNNILIQPLRGMIISSSLSSLSAGGWIDAGSTVHTAQAADNVGIGGITTADERLTVSGNISASGTIYGADSDISGTANIGGTIDTDDINVSGSIYTTTVYDHGHINTIVPNFSASNLQKVVIDGAATFNNSSAKTTGGSITLRVSAYNANCQLAFNSSWTFIGMSPYILPANTYGVLSLQSFGPAEADIIASFGMGTMKAPIAP